MIRLRVKEIAGQKGVSMHKLSQKSQVSYNIIRRLFNNPFQVINTDTLGRIATALEVAPGELIEDVPQEEVGKEQNEP
jgi:DNA-binding Xre family transcriptional regulator